MWFLYSCKKHLGLTLKFRIVEGIQEIEIFEACVWSCREYVRPCFVVVPSFLQMF